MEKFKLASSSLTDRLKSGSRLVTTKMKEILQSPTPESKIVDEATLASMEDPNWGLNLRICAMINSGELSGTEIVKAIKKKLFDKSVVTQRLSLELLEASTSNCDKVFSEVASEKVLDDIVKLFEDMNLDDEIRRKAFEMVRAWGENEDLVYLPAFRQTYMALQTRGIPTAGAQAGDVRPDQYTLESYIGNEEMMVPPEQYPIPDTNDQTSQYVFGGLSVQDNKEFLVVTRNSLDLLSTILQSGTEPTLVKEDLTVSMLEKCRQSLPVVQRIAESTNDNEAMLFEALNLHDELRQVISRCNELEASLLSGGEQPEVSDSITKIDSPIPLGSPREVSLTGDTKNANDDTAMADSSPHVVNYSNDTKTELNANATEADSAIHAGSHSSDIRKENIPSIQGSISGKKA